MASCMPTSCGRLCCCRFNPSRVPFECHCGLTVVYETYQVVIMSGIDNKPLIQKKFCITLYMYLKTYHSIYDHKFCTCTCKSLYFSRNKISPIFQIKYYPLGKHSYLLIVMRHSNFIPWWTTSPRGQLSPDSFSVDFGLYVIMRSA